MVQFGFHYDNTRCTGCKTCLFACHDSHDATADSTFRTVYDLEAGSWEKRADGSYSTNCVFYHLSMACNHCDEPACVSACPVAALYKEERRGLVLIDHDACVACGACAKACPYGAPKLDAGLGCAVKCNACEERLDQGVLPICVMACPSRALDLGPIDELRERFGEDAQIYPLPAPSLTKPNLVITPSRAALDPEAVNVRVANPREVE